MDSKEINRIIETIKIPHFYRDLMVLIGGLSFGVLVYYFYHPQVNRILNTFEIKNFSLEVDFLILVLSYILGRLLLILSKIILAIYYFVIKIFTRRIYLRSFKALYQEQKMRWHLFISRTNTPHSTSVHALETTTTVAEMGLIKEKFPSVADNFERENLNAIFLSILTATLFLGLVPFKWNLVIPFLISFCLLVQSNSRINYNNIQLFEAATKEAERTRQQTLKI